MDIEETHNAAAVRDWETDVSGGPLRMAIVGLGWFGADVGFSAIERSEHCAVSVVVSGDAAKADRIAENHDLTAGITYDEYHDGQAADAYDAVYVTTPNARHLPMVDTAANLGKHILCEKPMEATLERARTMVDVCAAAGVDLMVAYRMQTTPEIRRLRELIANGAIGTPVHAEGTFTFHINPGPDTWRVDPSLAGGAALLDIGVYPINTLRFVLDADPIALSAHAVSESAGFEDVVDEHVTVNLEFPGGTTAACHASFNAHPENRLRIVGTNGRIELDPVFDVQADRTLELDTTDGRLSVGTNVDEMVEEFDYFACGVLGDTEIEPDGLDGLTDMEILDATFEAAATGERIELDHA